MIQDWRIEKITNRSRARLESVPWATAPSLNAPLVSLSFLSAFFSSAVWSHKRRYRPRGFCADPKGHPATKRAHGEARDSIGKTKWPAMESDLLDLLRLCRLLASSRSLRRRGREPTCRRARASSARIITIATISRGSNSSNSSSNSPPSPPRRLRRRLDLLLRRSSSLVPGRSPQQRQRPPRHLQPR